MIEKKILTDEELEGITGGTTYYENTIPQGAIIFTTAPNFYRLEECTCSNIDFNGNKSGKNGGKVCKHCKRVDTYENSNGYARSCCCQYASDFKKIN